MYDGKHTFIGERQDSLRHQFKRDGSSLALVLVLFTHNICLSIKLCILDKSSCDLTTRWSGKIRTCKILQSDSLEAISYFKIIFHTSMTSRRMGVSTGLILKWALIILNPNNVTLWETTNMKSLITCVVYHLCTIILKEIVWFICIEKQKKEKKYI